MKLTEGFNLLATAPDGIKRLRELILSLAVQGKLVPQDPNDEPASELLKQIRAEKQRLIAEGKIKKDKPLPVIGDDEQPFDLPDSWEWVRLGLVGDVVGGGTPKSDNPEYWSENEIPWLTPADLYGLRQKFIKKGRRYISSAGLKNSSTQLMPEGAVLFSSRAPIGYVAIAASTLTTNQGFKSLVPYTAGLSDYIYWFLKSAARQIDENASGTTFKEISGSEFARIAFPLPPLAEQSRIVAKVEELMTLCDALETRGKLEAEQHARLTATLFDVLAASESAHQLQENWARLAASFDLVLDRPEAVDALEQTLLQLAVRGLLVPQDPADEPASELLKQIRAEKDRLIADGKIKKDKPLSAIADDEKPFELPQGWEWVRLQQIGFSFDYGTSQKASEIPHGTPVLRMGNIQTGKVTLTGLKYFQDSLAELPDLFMRKDDLLFNRTNSYELVGKTGIFDGEDDTYSFASYLIRIRLMQPLINPVYVNYYLNSRDCRLNEIEPEVVQQNGQANFNGTKLKNIKVPLAPLAEQSRIVVRVEALRALCGQLRERLAASRQTQAHLAEAMVART